MNQIYHNLTDRRHTTSIINVMTYRGANYDSETYLVKSMHKASIQTRKWHYRKEQEKIIWNSYRDEYRKKLNKAWTEDEVEKEVNIDPKI